MRKIVLAVLLLGFTAVAVAQLENDDGYVVLVEATSPPALIVPSGETVIVDGGA